MRVVVINLDRSVERLAMFRAQADQLGIAFERLAAVDAATIRETRGRLTPPEIACFESHRLAWRSLIESGEPWLAVFEDDVHIEPPIASLLESSDWIPGEADLVKLETFNVPVSVAPKGTPAHGCNLHRLLSTHLGSAGYAISRQWASVLLASTEYYSRPVDWALFDQESDASHGALVVQVVPAPCIQEQVRAERDARPSSFESLILRVPGALTRQNLSETRKLWRELCRVVRQIGRLPVLIGRAIRPSRQITVPFVG